jgi:hypothetical protein
MGLKGYLYNKLFLKRKIFEEEQKKKGLVKFKGKSKKEQWGTPEQVEIWKKEEELEREQLRKLKEEKRERELREKEIQRKIREEEERSLFHRIIQSIKDFEPLGKYDNEITYHIELARHLKNEFPTLQIEKQKGASRPDIVIKDIAIEVKGPTYENSLESIACKCMKYSENFPKLIVVLFEVRASQNWYKEWLSSLEKQYPNVEVIKKPNYLYNNSHQTHCR